MYTPIVIYKGRTMTVAVNLGEDISGDVFSSQIRVAEKVTSQLIATWQVSFLTDGTDGRLLLTLDDSVTSTITKTNGFMDLKRVTAGEPVHVFEDALPVVIKGTVTE